MKDGSKQKKIFVLTDWFVPGYKAGGPIQSCANLVFALKKKYEIYVFTSDTDHGDTEPYQSVESNKWLQNLDPEIQVYYANNKTFSFSQIKEQIDFVQPDYVYLNHMFSPRYVLYPLWLKLSGFIKGDIVLCPRGALYNSALSVKRYKKKPFLVLFKCTGLHKKIRFHATNKKEEQAIQSFFPTAAIVIANNLPVTQQSQLSVTEKKTGVLKIIFVARIHPIKNLLFLIQCLQTVKADVLLTIVGPIEDSTYWQQCEGVVKNLPSNVHVKSAGPVNNSELQPLLLNHHLFVLPTKGENFGHSIFESFNAGRPVLISDQTPWQNLQDQQIGWSLSLNHAEKFTHAIEEAAFWNQETFNRYCENAWKYANIFTSNPQLLSPYYQLFS